MYYFFINITIKFLLFTIVLNSVKSLPEKPYYSYTSYNISEPTLSNDGSVRYKRQMDSKNNVYSSMKLSMAYVALKCGVDMLKQQIDSPTLVTTKKPNACNINVTELDFKQALIIDPFDRTKFLYPNSESIISFFEDEQVFLSCSGPGNFLRLLPSLFYQTFSCVCGRIFKAGEEFFDFHDLIYDVYPKHNIIDKGVINPIERNLVNHELIDHRYHEYEIGFHVDGTNNFVKIIDIVYNDDTLSTHYVKSTISRYIAGGQDTSAKNRFDQTYCCGHLSSYMNHVNMDEVYKPGTQDASFVFQLKNQDKLKPKDRYLKIGTEYLFNRGHLTPKASMIYSAAAMATYAYLNVVPQWKSINGGNWKRIEDHIVDMAIELEKDLLVITGAFGQLQYEDTSSDNGNMRPMYLYSARQREINIEMAPIPLYTFKLVVEPQSKRGVVYVTVNDPYAANDLPTLCDQPRTRIATVKNPKQWKYMKKEFGISYICRVSDFLNKTNILLIDAPGYDITEFLCIPEGCDYNNDPIDKSTTTTTTVAPTTMLTDTTTQLKIHDELKRRDLGNRMWLLNQEQHIHELFDELY